MPLLDARTEGQTCVGSLGSGQARSGQLPFSVCSMLPARQEEAGPIRAPAPSHEARLSGTVDSGPAHAPVWAVSPHRR